ncbi:DNA-nicking Smr family endonuclease [Rhodovulum iodosum]|uniref:DNA-nicking Smr family endonuclease n=1 Tax=Rhodovulum iodosum TaxID=68291 RepID=A0ABV3XRY8_9RHOB|nr:Smr/MutS family protein [Rhodovulum robiginosum]RSK30312.1 DNA mismatch repair protein MutS [Rhodovulum robiginosum]
MARRRPGTLSAEDRALWRKVADSATPLHGTGPRPELGRSPEPADRTPPPPRLPEFRVGERAPDATAEPGARPTHAPIRMDRKSFLRMKGGKLVPEARIDLHGMTLAQAHPALTGFVRRAHSDGKRLVLVITGKGRDRDEGGPVPQRRGVLKHQVPAWLGAPPLAGLVLQVTEAHRKHGGAGAYYVYLRRHR